MGANLNIRITASDDQARRTFGQLKGDIRGVGEAASQSGGMFGGLLDGLGKLGLAGIGISAVTETAKALGSALLGPINAASDLSESVSKVGVVFGPAAAQIEAFGASASQALGQSKQQALAAAGTFGNLFVSMGLGQEEAAELSKNILTLGGDLASFNNIDSTDALEKLRAGLVGEAEPLRALGVNMNEAAVKARAMQLGLQNASGELSEAAKVQARYSLIMEQTTTAQGDFARTSTGLANAQRIIQAEFANLSTEIGSRLLPAVVPLVSQFATALPAALDAVLPLFDLFGQGVQVAADLLTTFLIPHLTDLGAVVQRVFAGDFQGAVDLLTSEVLPRIQEFGGAVLAWIGEQLPEIAAQLQLWAAEFVAWVAPLIPPVLAALADLGGALFAWIAAQAPVLLRTLLGEWVPAFIGWVLPMIPVLLDQMGHVLLGLGGWLVNTAAPELLRFAGALGRAIIDGIIQALAPLGQQVSDAIGRATAGAGNALIQNIQRGVQAAAPGLYNAVRGVVGQVDNLLPHSLAREGPLSRPVNWTDVLRGNLPSAMADLLGTVRRGTGEIETLLVGVQQTAQRTSQELAALFNARNTAAGIIPTLDWSNPAIPGTGSGGGGGGGGGINVPGGQAAVEHAKATGSDWHATFNFERGLGRSEADARAIADAAQKRQMGGPVWPWQSYLVGERGPELFVPQTAGQIVPNGALGGGSQPILLTLQLDGQVIGRASWNYLKGRAAAGATMGF